MKINYLLWCLFFCVFACPCLHAASQTGKECEQIAKTVKEMTAKEIQQQYKVRPLIKEFNRKRTEQQYKKALTLAFIVQPPMSIDQARKLLIEWTHIYLKNINQSPELKVILPEFPCSPYSIEIVCAVIDPKKNENYENSLFMFSMADGALQYFAYDHEVIKRCVHLETYGDACEILVGRGERINTSYGTKSDLGTFSPYLKPMLQIERNWEEELLKDPKTKFIHKSLSDGAFPANIAIRQATDQARQSTTYVGIAPIPFFRAVFSHRAYNYAVGDDFLPLLDVEGVTACFEGGAFLSGPGPKAAKWPLSPKVPLYTAIVKARESKFGEENGWGKK
jgi:hypothetical protein